MVPRTLPEPEVSVRYPRDGSRNIPLDRLLLADFEGSVPWRVFRSRRGPRRGADPARSPATSRNSTRPAFGSTKTCARLSCSTLSAKSSASRWCRDWVRRRGLSPPRGRQHGIRFMSAPSPPAGPKIGLPATLRKPRNPVPDRRPSRDCAGRRYYSFRPATRPFAGPARRRGVLPDGGIPWLVSASPSVTAVRLGLPGRL